MPGLQYQMVHNARKAAASQGRPKPAPKPVDPDPAKPDDNKQKPIVDPVKPDDKKPVVDPVDPNKKDPEENLVYSEKAICLKDHGKVFITNDGESVCLRVKRSS